MRASTHGLLLNTIHSLCTCSQLVFSEETMRFLRLFLAELSLDKFYKLFYIEDVKSSAVTAFQCNEKINSVGEKIKLQDLECLVDSLVEIMEACLSEVPGSLWLQQWAELVQRFAFQYNPAFQPRAIVVLGCISRNATDMDIRALLQILVSHCQLQ